MPDVKCNQLGDLLDRKIKVVSDRAISTEGDIPADQMDSLDRLSRLIEICDTAGRQHRNRWPLVVMLGSALMIASILFFARVSKTEIELDLLVSEVSFRLPTIQVLTAVINLSAMGVSGLEEIRLPRIRRTAARRIDVSEGAGNGIHLSIASVGKHQGIVSLQELTVPADNRVWVAITQIPNQYRLSFQGSSLELQAGVKGPVKVKMPGADPEQLDFRMPKLISLHSASDKLGIVDLDLTFPTSFGLSKEMFMPQLPVSDLRLIRVDQFMGPEQDTVVRHVSTVLSGALYLESLNGQKQPLRPGEWIQFKQSDGEIRTLQLSDDKIIFKFHGSVRGMSIGSGASRRCLMPTYLEWLTASHGLTLLWGTAAYLFGLIAAVLRWWRMTS